MKKVNNVEEARFVAIKGFHLHFHGESLPEGTYVLCANAAVNFAVPKEKSINALVSRAFHINANALLDIHESNGCIVGTPAFLASRGDHGETIDTLVKPMFSMLHCCTNEEAQLGKKDTVVRKVTSTSGAAAAAAAGYAAFDEDQSINTAMADDVFEDTSDDSWNSDSSDDFYDRNQDPAYSAEETNFYH